MADPDESNDERDADDEPDADEEINKALAEEYRDTEDYPSENMPDAVGED